VKEGEVLITLDPTISDADYAKMKLDVEENRALISRLKLEKRGAPLTSVNELIHPMQRDIFRTRLQEHTAKLHSIDLGIEKAKSSLKKSRGALEMAKLGLEETKYNYAKQNRLVSEGILSDTALKEEQFKVDKSVSAVTDAETSLQMSQGDLDTKLSDRKSFLSGWFKQINEELSGAMAKRDSTKEELIKIEHKRSNIYISAPADGVVLELEDTFVGAIINSGQAVMTLVPVDVPLTIIMDIEPKDIGNLVVGSELSAKLSALPFQKHGDLTAELTFLSEDTIDESINGEPGSFYRARAEITSNNLKKVPENFRIVPGMQLNGDIKVAKRRVITYFLYPVIKTIETSFTEP
jgi:HlyD family secretion protein